MPPPLEVMLPNTESDPLVQLAPPAPTVTDSEPPGVTAMADSGDTPPPVEATLDLRPPAPPPPAWREPPPAPPPTTR